ncbi:Hypothetical predicted protein, partial [Olea europaea subsp. europaea]
MSLKLLSHQIPRHSKTTVLHSSSMASNNNAMFQAWFHSLTEEERRDFIATQLAASPSVSHNPKTPRTDGKSGSTKKKKRSTPSPVPIASEDPTPISSGDKTPLQTKHVPQTQTKSPT